MKFTISSAAALLSLASSALAAQQSRPFYLVAVSHFAAINNTAFVACHEGAAIEGFCVGQKIPKTKAEAATYRLNNTKQNPDEGLLSYQLVGNKFKVWEPMSLSHDVATNVAIPLFMPSDEGQQVGFDEHGLMYMKTYINDMVNPPHAVKPKKLYRWYTCTTLYSSYEYHTLAWVTGKSPPENPSCQRTEVRRMWVK